jgi:hypothetical protein
VQSCVGEELKQAYDAFCTQMKVHRCWRIPYILLYLP